MTIRQNTYQHKPHLYLSDGEWIFHLRAIAVRARTPSSARALWAYTDSANRGTSVETSFAVMRSHENYGKARP